MMQIVVYNFLNLKLSQDLCNVYGKVITGQPCAWQLNEFYLENMLGLWRSETAMQRAPPRTAHWPSGDKKRAENITS